MKILFASLLAMTSFCQSVQVYDLTPYDSKAGAALFDKYVNAKIALQKAEIAELDAKADFDKWNSKTTQKIANPPSGLIFQYSPDFKHAVLAASPEITFWDKATAW